MNKTVITTIVIAAAGTFLGTMLYDKYKTKNAG